MKTAEEMREFTSTIVKNLVDTPEVVSIDVMEAEKTYVFTIRCKNDEIREIIGKRKRLLDAVQTVLRAAAHGKNNTLEFTPID